MTDVKTDKLIAESATFKPKKSVALSGVAAGNTALCSVGRSGNDLHYRGYDILDVADNSEFEEIAYLLVHGKLPNDAIRRSAMSRAPAMLWSSFSGSTQPSTETPVRITSIGCAPAGSASSAAFTACGRPRSDFSFAL